MDNLDFDTMAQNDAVDLLKKNGNVGQYLNYMTEEYGWTPEQHDRFFSIMDRVRKDPNVRQQVANYNPVEEEAQRQFKEQTAAWNPLVRDVLSGFKGTVMNTAALGARAASAVTGGETASEIIRNKQIEDQLAAETYGPRNVVAKNVQGVTESLTSAMTFAPLGMAGVIGGFAANRGNQAIVEAENAGLSGKEKWGYVGRAAAIEGGVTAAFSLLGAAGFEKFFKGTSELTKAGVKDLLKSIGVAGAQELPEETVVEILDRYNQAVSGVSEDQFTWETAFQAFKDVSVPTLMSVGIAGGVKGIAAQPKLKQREAFIDTVADRHGLERVVVEQAYTKAAESKGDFDVAFGREIERETLKTTDGIVSWAQRNPEAAIAIMDNQAPSRGDFEKAGLPPMDGEARKALAETLRVENARVIEEQVAADQATSQALPTEEQVTAEQAAATAEAQQPQAEPVAPSEQPAPPAPATEQIAPNQPIITQEQKAAFLERAAALQQAQQQTAQPEAQAPVQPVAEQPVAEQATQPPREAAQEPAGVVQPETRPETQVTPETPPAGPVAQPDAAQEAPVAPQDMDLPTLRAAAKELGIKTGGKKRAWIEAQVAKARGVGADAVMDAEPEAATGEQESTGTPAEPDTPTEATADSLPDDQVNTILKTMMDEGVDPARSLEFVNERLTEAQKERFKNVIGVWEAQATKDADREARTKRLTTPEPTTDPATLTYRDLQALAKELGVTANGKKDVLVDRVRAAQGAREVAQETAKPAPAAQQEATPATEATDTPTTPRVQSPTANLTDADRTRLDELKNKVASRATSRMGMSQALDPEFIRDTAEIATIYAKGGARTFGQIASVMKQEFAEAWDAIRTHLYAAYEQMRKADPTLPDITEVDAQAELAAMDQTEASVDVQAQEQEQARQEAPVEIPEEPAAEAEATTAPPEPPTITNAPEKPVPAPDNIDDVGMRHAYSDAVREKFGFTPRAEQAKQADADLESRVKEVRASDPQAGTKLVDRMNLDQNRNASLSADETVLLGYEIKDRMDELDRANATFKDAMLSDMSEEEVNDLADQVEAQNKRVTEALDVLDRAGSAQGAAFRARQFIIDSQFNLSRMETQLREKQGGKPLTKEQEKALNDLKVERDRAMEQVEFERIRHEEQVAKLNQELADAWAAEVFARESAAVLEELKKDSPIRKKALKLADDLEARALAGLKAMKGKTFSAEAALAEYTLHAVEFGAAKILKGVVKLSDWTAAMKATFDRLTDDQLKDVRSRSQQMAKEQIAAQSDKDQKRAEKRRGKRESAPKEPSDPQAELRAEVKKLFRVEVQSGVTDLDTALNNVHQQVVQNNPNMTREEVRDLFSDYGRARKIDNTVTKKVLADLRRQAQLLASIERVQQQLAPLKSGAQREKPSQKVRELTRELNRLMKEAGITTRDSETEIASQLQRMKTRARNDIEDYQKAIANRERMVKESGKVVAMDDELKSLKTRRDELKAEYQAMFPKEPMSDEKRIDMAIKQAERRLEQAQADLELARDGKPPKNPELRKLPENAQLRELKDQIARAKAEAKFLREMAAPGMAAVRAKEKRLAAAITRMKEQMKAGEFPANRVEPIDMAYDEQSLQAQRDYAKVHAKWQQMKAQAEWESMTPLQRAGKMVTAAWQAPRMILLSFDTSFVGRQGNFMMMAHPKQFLEVAKAGTMGVSKSKSQQYSVELENDPLYKSGVLKKMGVKYAEARGDGNFQEVDDYTELDLVDRIPVVGKVIIDPSSRSAAQASNRMKLILSKSLLGMTEIGRGILEKEGLGLTKAEREHIEVLGWGVNVLTGTGNKSLHGANMILTSARFMLATMQGVTGAPVWRSLARGDKQAAGAFAKEYARYAGTVAAIYAMAYAVKAMAGGDDDEKDMTLNPLKPGVGDIPIPGTSLSWNPMNQYASYLKYLAPLAAGRKYTRSGDVIRLSRITPFAGDEVKAQDVDVNALWEHHGRFAKGKLHPAIHAIVAMTSGKDFMGRDKASWRLLLESILPISTTTSVEAFATQDPASAAILTAAEVFGFDVTPDYDTRAMLEFHSATDAEYRKEAAKRLNKALAPSASDTDRVKGLKAVYGMSFDDAKEMMMAAEREDKPGKSDQELFQMFYGNGNRTRWGEKMRDLKTLIETADPKSPVGQVIFNGFKDKAGGLESGIAEASLEGMSQGRAEELLRQHMRRYGKSTSYYYNGKKTEYGRIRDRLDEFYKGKPGAIPRQKPDA